MIRFNFRWMPETAKTGPQPRATRPRRRNGGGDCKVGIPKLSGLFGIVSETSSLSEGLGYRTGIARTSSRKS